VDRYSLSDTCKHKATVQKQHVTAKLGRPLQSRSAGVPAPAHDRAHEGSLLLCPLLSGPEHTCPTNKLGRTCSQPYRCLQYHSSKCRVLCLELADIPSRDTRANTPHTHTCQCGSYPRGCLVDLHSAIATMSTRFTHVQNTHRQATQALTAHTNQHAHTQHTPHSILAACAVSHEHPAPAAVLLHQVLRQLVKLCGILFQRRQPPALQVARCVPVVRHTTHLPVAVT
jgi:hypothetical protein